MGINAAYVLAGIAAAGTSGAELAWFGPTGTTAPVDSTTALASPANEVQTITITGTPTGGTFTLTYGGQTTSAIAFNATASAVQAALVALTSVGSGGVTVSGGPGPGTPYVATFGGLLAGMNLSNMTATGTFTGGTTPAIAVTETTPGASGFSSAGLISEDGITKAVKDTSKDVRAYGLSAPIRKIVTAEEVSFQVKFLETNKVSQSVYNRLPLAGTGTVVPSGGAFSVTDGTFRAQRYAFVCDCIDGANHIRIYCPSVEVTDKNDQVIKAGEVIEHGVTLTAYPDASGVAATTFYLIPGLT